MKSLDTLSLDNVRLLSVQTSSHQVTVIMDLQSHQATCPHCGTLSSRKHGRYMRLVQDLPRDDREVRYFLCSNKWFCDNVHCPTHVFTERFPWLAPHRRKTKRLEEKLTMLAFSTSCLKAEKICRELHMPVSHDTLLNLVYQKKGKKRKTPFRRIG